MANIDVTDCLLDPDFVDPVVVIRRTASIDDFGKTVLIENSINTYASVQPASMKTIMRLPEELRMEDIRSFYLMLPLVLDGTTDYPDILVFGGKRFQIRTSAPWLNFGTGWNEGVCVAEKPS